MFTGIIEEIATVQSLDFVGSHYRLTVAASTVLENLRLGDSIATNGVCLTVARFDAAGFAADVMPETLRRTNLGSLRKGDKVNLERALAVGDRLGGHIVSGHIDGIGTIVAKHSEGDAVVVGIAAEADILGLIVAKGSIAIDGISLTVVAVEPSHFTVSLVGHTQHHATLASKRVGDRVNLENDILAKYVRKFVGTDTPAHSLLDLL